MNTTTTIDLDRVYLSQSEREDILSMANFHARSVDDGEYNISYGPLLDLMARVIAEYGHLARRSNTGEAVELPIEAAMRAHMDAARRGLNLYGCVESSLRAALAAREGQQEPVATVRVTNGGYGMELSTYIAYALPEGKHDLYAAPVAQQSEAGAPAGGEFVSVSALREFGQKWLNVDPQALDALNAVIEAQSIEAGAPTAAAELSDDAIERGFQIAGGRWEGSHWVMEDADLHPYVRSLLSGRPTSGRESAAPAAPVREGVGEQDAPRSRASLFPSEQFAAMQKGGQENG